MSYSQIMRRARKTNRQRDILERAHGLAAPGDRGPLMHLRVAMEAIKAGMITNDLSTIAEGQAMLEDLERDLIALTERDNDLD